MKKTLLYSYGIAALIALGIAIISNVAYGAPTSTIVQNLFISDLKNNGVKCLQITNAGLVQTSTAACGSGSGGLATSTLGDYSSGNILFVFDPSTVSASSGLVFNSSTGMLGIGTSTPKFKLHIYSTSTQPSSTLHSSARFESAYDAGLELIADSDNDTNETGTPYIYLSSDADYWKTILQLNQTSTIDALGNTWNQIRRNYFLWGNITNDANGIQFGTRSTARVTIDDLGLVGIGTAFPSSTLHVIGDFRVASATIRLLLDDSGNKYVTSTVGSTPGNPIGSIQFNESGNFAGSSSLVFATSTKTLHLYGIVSSTESRFPSSTIALLFDASGNQYVTSTSGSTPGAPVGGLQYNESGAFAATSTLVFATTTRVLHVYGLTSSTEFRSPSSTISIGAFLTGLTFKGDTVTTSTGANPSASLGLTAVNGTANTFMRSDGAPALSLSITPVWTGLHQFSGAGASSSQLWSASTSVNFSDALAVASGGGKLVAFLAQSCGGTDKISSISASGTVTCTADSEGSASPGNPIGGIQFNESGSFAASSSLSFATTTRMLQLFGLASSTEMRTPSSTIDVLTVNNSTTLSGTCSGAGCGRTWTSFRQYTTTTAERWYPPSREFDTMGAVAISPNQIKLLPLNSADATKITGVAYNITAAIPGRSARVCIYNTTTTPNSIFPGALLADVAYASTTGTGVQNATTSIAVTQNTLYWVAIFSDSTSTIRSQGSYNAASILGFDITLPTTQGMGWNVSSTWGVCPTDYPTPAVVWQNAGNIPVPFFRFTK